MNTDTPAAQASDRVQVPPHPTWPALDADVKAALKARIKRLLAEQNAVLVAHYYVDGELQALAEETGGYVADSLEMARSLSRSKRSSSDWSVAMTSLPVRSTGIPCASP